MYILRWNGQKINDFSVLFDSFFRIIDVRGKSQFSRQITQAIICKPA